MINGKQCTILWHVDDLKISREDPAVVTDIIWQPTCVVSTSGMIHEYLKMTIHFTYNGKIKITMYDYVDGMISKLPPEMIGESATPASNHLFEICDNNDANQLLTPQLSEESHHLVAKTLFLSKQARPNLHTAVVFLITRVMSPNNNDPKKLSKLLNEVPTRDLIPSSHSRRQRFCCTQMVH